MNTTGTTYVLGTLALVLAGCGGGNSEGNGAGGGDDRADVIDPPGGSQLSVSTDNASEISGEVVGATLGLVEFGDTFGTGPFASTDGSDAATQVGAVSGKALGNLSKLKSATESSLKTEISETVDCAVSGSLSLSASLEDPLTITVGDSYMSQFTACDEGDGLLTDGGLDFVITDFAGDFNDLLFGGGYRLGTAITATDLQFTFDGITTTTDGEFTILFDTTVSPITRLEFFGSRFDTREAGTFSYVLRDFSLTSTVDEGQFPELYTLESRGTLESSTLGGTVSFDTVQAFRGLGDDFPFEGAQITTGAGGSSVTLIAVDSVSVRLEIDVDGDGAVDETRDTTWEAVTQF